MVEQCPQVSFKLCRGNETNIIWHIENWNCPDDDDFQLLRSNAKCLVNVSPGGSKELKKSSNPIPGACLRFYFQDFKNEKYEYGTDKGDTYVHTHWLSLFAEELSNKRGQILKYHLKIELVDYKFGNSIEKSVKFKTGETRKEQLKDEFIKLEIRYTKYNDSTTVYPRPSDLRIKITVIPVFIVAKDSNEGADPKVNEETSLCLALKNMYAAEEKYTDLTLISKDGVVKDVHKFILAARSPILRELIEKEGRRNDFEGRIKLPDVNGKPLNVIVHWMYTGELEETAGKCMEEVVDAAIKFRLTGLVNILDRKLITVCNYRNMFDLYRVAEKNELENAVVDITKFIKKSLDRD